MILTHNEKRTHLIWDKMKHLVRSHAKFATFRLQENLFRMNKKTLYVQMRAVVSSLLCITVTTHAALAHSSFKFREVESLLSLSLRLSSQFLAQLTQEMDILSCPNQLKLGGVENGSRKNKCPCFAI